MERERILAAPHLAEKHIVVEMGENGREVCLIAMVAPFISSRRASEAAVSPLPELLSVRGLLCFSNRSINPKNKN